MRYGIWDMSINPYPLFALKLVPCTLKLEPCTLKPVPLNPKPNTQHPTPHHEKSIPFFIHDHRFIPHVVYA